MPDQTWRKSSRSGNNATGNCVEVAFSAGVVGIRDSKNPAGPPLTFAEPAWSALAAALRPVRGLLFVGTLEAEPDLGDRASEILREELFGAR